MRNRPNVVGPILLGVLVFVAGLWLALHGPAYMVLVLASAGALHLSAEQLADFEERFRNTVEPIGFCNASRHMEIDCGDLSRALKNDGSRAIDARRIEQLPTAQVQEWYWAGVERFGIPKRARRMLRIVDVEEIA